MVVCLNESLAGGSLLRSGNLVCRSGRDMKSRKARCYCSRCMYVQSLHQKIQTLVRVMTSKSGARKKSRREPNRPDSSSACHGVPGSEAYSAGHDWSRRPFISSSSGSGPRVLHCWAAPAVFHDVVATECCSSPRAATFLMLHGDEDPGRSRGIGGGTSWESSWALRIERWEMP
nr:hypothetical protein CFP56_31510 [Quercus suber]